MKKNNKLDVDNTYSDFYDEKEEVKEEIPFVDYSDNIENEKKTSTKMKIVNAIGIIVGLIAAALIVFSVIEPNANYNVKFNLTSLGLVKTRGISGSYQIDYLVLPNNNDLPIFKIKDPEIIKINEATSYITALKKGETIIEALDIKDNKTVKNTLKIFVVDKEVPISSFYASSVSVDVGKSEIIKITPYPENTTEINFNYKSSDEKIAIVNNDGIVKGISEGKAQITITNGKITRSTTVNVRNND